MQYLRFQVLLVCPVSISEFEFCFAFPCLGACLVLVHLPVLVLKTASHSSDVLLASLHLQFLLSSGLCIAVSRMHRVGDLKLNRIRYKWWIWVYIYMGICILYGVWGIGPGCWVIITSCSFEEVELSCDFSFFTTRRLLASAAVAPFNRPSRSAIWIRFLMSIDVDKYTKWTV